MTPQRRQIENVYMCACVYVYACIGVEGAVKTSERLKRFQKWRNNVVEPKHFWDCRFSENTFGNKHLKIPKTDAIGI